MYTHSTATGPQTAENHAVDPQWFQTVNERRTYVCGLCGGLVVRWVTDHGTGWVHA